MIGILGTVLKLVAKPLTAAVAAIPKGNATGVGGLIGAAGVLGAVVAPHVVTDQNVVAIIEAIAKVVLAIGSVIASMGAMRHEVLTK